MTGAESIAAERQRQIDEEGWTKEHDRGHEYGELGVNAAALLVDGTDYSIRPAPECDFGLVAKHGYRAASRRGVSMRSARRRALVIAGALVAAEIDRLDNDQ